MDHPPRSGARPSEEHQPYVLFMHSPCTHHAPTMHSPCTYHLLTSDPYSCQVSEEFATISAARLLTAQNCWERILFGPRSFHLERIVARQVTRPAGRVRAPMALPWLHFPRRGATRAMPVLAMPPPPLR